MSQRKQDVKSSVLETIDQRRQDSVDTLRDLVRIRSVNPVFVDSEPEEEKEAQEYLAERLNSLGFETELFEPDVDHLEKYRGKPGFTPGREFDNRPNLYGLLEGAGEGRSFFLSGHIDVVGADPEEEDWEYDPFEARIVDGVMHGRGTVDMKGGIVAMLKAVENIQRTGYDLEGDVHWGTVVDEETGGMGMLSLVDRGHRADGGVMTEPTDNRISLVSRGILWGRIEVRGKAGHIEIDQPHWSEGGTVDAIGKARKLLRGIDDLNEEWAKRPDKNHPLLPQPCQVNVSMIEGGQHPSSWAEECTITVDVQYLPHEVDEVGLGSEVKEEVEEQLMRVADADPWLRDHPPTFDWFVDADTAELDPQLEVVQSMQRAMEGLDMDTDLTGTEAHTDMTRLTKTGTPTYNFGPGPISAAHQTNEKLPLDDFIDAEKALAMMLIEWCGVR